MNDVEQSVPQIKTRAKKGWKRRRNTYSDGWADTRTITIATGLLFDITCWPPDRAYLTFRLAWLVWAKQRRLPDSIEGWSAAQLRDFFGSHFVDFRRLRKWYSADLVNDVDKLTWGRTPLCDGAREEIFEKGSGLCHHCGCALESDDFHVDHLVPIVQGGMSSNTNLVPSCPPCNRSKGGRML